MATRFNDEDFDGVVLKIDMGFIMTNPEMVEHLEDFRQKLLQCQYSTMLPSHERNLNELEDYKDKSALIKSQRDKENALQLESKKSYENELQLKLQHLILPLEQDKYDCSIQHDEFEFGGNVYSEKEICTNKYGIKSAFRRTFAEFLAKCTTDEYETFLTSVGCIYYLSLWNTPLFDKTKTSIRVDNYGNLILQLPIHRVHFYQRGKRKRSNIQYISPVLRYDHERSLYYVSDNPSKLIKSEIYTKQGQETRTYLVGYNVKGDKLVKSVE